MKTLQQYIGRAQAACLREMLKGEEADHFRAVVARIESTISTMPTSYQTDGQGDAAMACLHYFTGGCDWWIIERDSDTDGAGQVQAFGLASLNGCGQELGYISIPEILSAGAELDFYFTPRPVGDIRANRAA